VEKVSERKSGGEAKKDLAVPEGCIAMCQVRRRLPGLRMGGRPISRKGPRGGGKASSTTGFSA